MGSPNCGGHTHTHSGPRGEEGRVRGHLVRKDGCKGSSSDSL